LGEKKAVSRKVALGIGLVCIALIIIIGGIVANYTLALNGKNAQITTLQNQNDELQNQVSSDNSTISSLNTEISSLQAQVASENLTTKQLKNELSTEVATISSLENTTSYDYLEINSLNTTITRLNTEITSLHTQISSLQTQLSTLETTAMERGTADSVVNPSNKSGAMAGFTPTDKSR
jgi:chromosome segregation ATPase